MPIYGDGSAIRDFTHVADVVDATVAAATAEVSGHVILNVAGGSPSAINDVLDLIAGLIERPLHLDHLPSAKGDPDRTGAQSNGLSP